MSIVYQFQTIVRNTVISVFEQNSWPISDITRVVLEEPKDSSHGELSTNAALVLAKASGHNPKQISEALVSELKNLRQVESVFIAGPGFINFKMHPEFWNQILPQILLGTYLDDIKYFGNGHKVNIEYVSANPTGPMHVGHGRGAVFGDVLANLMAKTGWKVTKEYYINDAGGQIDVLANSVLWRLKSILGDVSEEMPEDLYPGEYLIPLAKSLAAETQQHNKLPDISHVSEVAIHAMMNLIRDDLLALGVSHDIFFSERSLTQCGKNKVETSLELLESMGHIFIGSLASPKGEVNEKYVAREQTLFRATAFGDSEDRAVQKENGDYTYFASDIAYHHDKLERGYSRLIDVWGADHAGYTSRMKAVVKALSNSKVNLEVVLCQLVRLQRNGEPVRMSKRSGDFVTLREVLDEVGRDAVRFMMIYRKADAPLDFDLTKVVEQSKDNPVFYVQYAHARICSVLRLAEQQNIEILPADKVLSQCYHLKDNSEKELIVACARFADIIQSSAETTEVHRLAFYLNDLASKFHAMWARGNSDHSLRLLQFDSLEISQARITLCACVAHILREGLQILGVSAPETM